MALQLIHGGSLYILCNYMKEPLYRDSIVIVKLTFHLKKKEFQKPNVNGHYFLKNSASVLAKNPAIALVKKTLLSNFSADYFSLIHTYFSQHLFYLGGGIGLGVCLALLIDQSRN